MDKLRTWLRAVQLEVLIRVLRVNAWLNVASISVLCVIGFVLGLAAIGILIITGVRG